jgi:glycosyltransferase involved in cell wall biosynthesis
MISICIPNFNYGSYLDATLASLNRQTNQQFEIVISDNASTDNSKEIIQKWENRFEKFKYRFNKCNIGFASNLDRVAEMASLEFMLMLSSDDLVNPQAIEVYSRFITKVQQEYPTESFFFGGQPTKINADGVFQEDLEMGSKIWYQEDLDINLTSKFGFNVYKVPGGEMLRRCFTRFRTPLHFITICYPRTGYNELEGYGGARLYNPDKWFNWKLLAHLDYVYYLDQRLFQYRWHDQNQMSLQQQTGTLKYWLDEYRNCFEVSDQMLQKANLERTDLEKYFVDHLLKGSGIEFLAGKKKMGQRLLHLAAAYYPQHYKKSPYWIRLNLLKLMYPFRNTIQKWIGR